MEPRKRRFHIVQLEQRIAPSANGTVLGLDLNRDDPLTASAADRGGADQNIGLVYCSTEGPAGGGPPGGCAIETTEILGLSTPPGLQ
jgi:hypothetical protein